jgi:tetratricopeptide (TPR) repeat protein
MMKRSARISIIALGLASATFQLTLQRAGAQTPAATATPETLGLGASDVTLAERYAGEAFEAYRIRDYGRAVALYEQALAAAPSPDIVYNIARVYDTGLRNRRLAIVYYERYTADPAAAPDRLETARQRVEELRAAERTTQSAGSGDIDAIARDFPLDLPEPAPAPAPPRPLRVRGGLRPLELGAVALGSAGLIGVGVGVGFGLSARSRTNAWQRDCDGNQCTSQRGVDTAEAAARRAEVATVGFAVGGGLIALGAVLWLIEVDSESPDEATALRVAPLASRSSLGGSVSGHF